MLLSGPGPLPAADEDGGGFKFRKDPDIGQTLPEKPVRIKLRRLSGGGYTWTIRGDDADKIIEADRKLRKRFGVDKEDQ